MPAISVVIPVYNAAPFLREALDSLLAQTCGDFEAIAVNDGSTDNSLEILQEYAARDSRIRILDGPNGGYGKAMNRGMDAATGKYMAILEPDDYLPREAYASLLPLAEEHQLDVVRGTHCSFYEDKGTRQFVYRLHAYKTGEVFRPLNEIPGVFQCGPGIWCNLYNIRFLRQHGIRFHESPGASYQDTGFFLLCAVYAERYMLVPDAVYMYRMDNPASSVKAIDSKKHMLLQEYGYVKNCLAKNAALWSHASPAFYWSFVSAQRWIFGQLSESVKQEFIEKLQSYAGSIIQANENMLPETQRLMQDFANGEYQKLKCILAPPQPLSSPLTKEKVFMGICWYSISMSSELTVRRLCGIPVLTRRRIPEWQSFSTWLQVASGRKDRYYVLGIPLWEKWKNPYGTINDVEYLPAKVEESRS